MGAEDGARPTFRKKPSFYPERKDSVEVGYGVTSG